MHSLTASAAYGVPRPALVGAGVMLLAVGAMFVDHMLEDPAEGGGVGADPPMFVISIGLPASLAAYLFGRVVPRAVRSSEQAGRTALPWMGVAIVSLPTTMWVGLPFVLAGAVVQLGWAGRTGPYRRRAIAATVVGVIVLVVGIVNYVAQAVDKLG